MQFLCSIIITNLILSLKARIIKISFIDKARLGIKFKSQLSVLEKVKPLIPENNFIINNVHLYVYYPKKLFYQFTG